MQPIPVNVYFHFDVSSDGFMHNLPDRKSLCRLCRRSNIFKVFNLHPQDGSRSVENVYHYHPHAYERRIAV